MKKSIDKKNIIINMINNHHDDIIIYFMKNLIMSDCYHATRNVVMNEFNRFFKEDKELVYGYYSLIVENIFSIIEKYCGSHVSEHKVELVSQYKGCCAFEIEIFNNTDFKSYEEDEVFMCFFINDSGEEINVK